MEEGKERKGRNDAIIITTKKQQPKEKVYYDSKQGYSLSWNGRHSGRSMKQLVIMHLYSGTTAECTNVHFFCFLNVFNFI